MSWSKVVQNSFGDPDNACLWDQAVHEGHLYVTTHTSALTAENHGDQVWGFFPPERYVSVTLGKDAGDCTDSALPCKSIQYGLDQSTNGELIKLAQGDYVGKNVINSRKMDVTLQGGWNESFSSRTDDPAGTRIVGIGVGSLLSIMGQGKDIQLKLSGMVLQAGFIDIIGGGGGIYALGDKGQEHFRPHPPGTGFSGQWGWAIEGWYSCLHLKPDLCCRAGLCERSVAYSIGLAATVTIRYRTL